MKIGIIGTGLIGGSLALAISATGKYTVYCYNRREAVSKKALRMKAAEKYFATIEELAEASDIIIIATPLGSYNEICRKISKYMTSEKIISDIGSVKGEPIRLALKALPKKFHKNFIPAHPIAGSENLGIENADAEMFEGKKLIITANRNNSNVEIIAKLWRSAGARPEIMSAKKHDEIYAYVSHYVQFLSFALKKIIKSEFGEFNRLMDSPRDIWKEIFQFNKANLLEINKEFMKEIKDPSKITSQDSDYILAYSAAESLDLIVPTKYKDYAGSGFKSFTSILKNTKYASGRSDLRYFKSKLKKLESELKKFK